jgi:hypothetical protein
LVERHSRGHSPLHPPQRQRRPVPPASASSASASRRR